MPAMIDIRAKRRAYEGGPHLWNAVVYGPGEFFDMDRALSRTLIRHGFSRLPGGTDREIWSTPPAPVAPPLYLGDFLGAKHRVAMTAATRALTESARAARKKGSALAGLVRSGSAEPGDAPLVVVAGARQFLANCSSDHTDRLNYLMGAGWLPIPEDRLTPAIIARFGSRPFMTGDPFIASNLTHLMTDRAREILEARTREARKFIESSKTQDAPEDFDIPAPEGLDYLPFQKAGIYSIAATGRSGVIADDMGLGKTIQGIGVINSRPEARNVLVTCQANMKLKWVRELKKWLINQSLSVAHADGSDVPETDIVVINYDIVDRNKEKLLGRKWDIILADEGHNMQNPEAKRTLAVLGDVINPSPDTPRLPLAKGGLFIPMTGTPKPNKVAGLWPLLSSTRPDIWGSGPEAYEAFINRYQPSKLIRKTVRKGRHEYQVTIPIPGEPVREMELQMRMRGSGSFMRRMKRDTDLPPKFRTPLELPFRFTEEDRQALAQIDADIETIARKVAIENGRIRVGEALPAGAIIDTIAGIPPSSPHFTEGARVRANLGLLKAPYMARFISEELLEDEDLPPEERRKTVVFAHHKTVISKMAEIIRRDFPDGVLVYDGSVTSPKKKQALVDRFETDPAARVFLMSKSGNSGITLTVSRRLRVAEPDWDPANMAQVEDRIWRIGQGESCDIGYLYAPGSHDMNIGDGLIRKMDSDERSLNSFVFKSKTSRKSAGDPHDALFGSPRGSDGPPRSVRPASPPDQDQMEMPL